MIDNPKIIGPFEQVGFPEFGMDNVTAKIDTGAFTGALHCTKIEETDSEEGKVLRFSPFDHPELTITTAEYVIKQVKSSNGERQRRYFIKTAITVHGERYKILLSLADRSEMKWAVLVGRRFLRRNHFLVDVRKMNQYGDEGKDTK